MKIEQSHIKSYEDMEGKKFNNVNGSADLVFMFGSRELLKNNEILEKTASIFPSAQLIGCSTAGEIVDTNVIDDSIVITAVDFEKTDIKSGCVKMEDFEDSYLAGKQLAESIPHEGLVHALVLSDGLHVNGSALVDGITQNLPADVTATGGLSGDGPDFRETVIVWDNEACSDSVSIVGFYGDSLKIGYGSLGGWDPFGPERLITKSTDNFLYELEGESALSLYKTYLGEYADGLPATGLLFPLTVRMPNSKTSVVRTILGVDEDTDSLIFAGNVPEGSYARLMKANFNRLVDGASDAAKTCYTAIGSAQPDLAILISCVGRKMILKQRVEEEVEAVRDVLGEGTVLSGFYSYGEISPFTPNAKCELHNQTMTITTFTET